MLRVRGVNGARSRDDTAAGIALCGAPVTDARSRRVLNRLMAGAYVATTLGVGLAAAVTGDWRQALAQAVLVLALLGLGVFLFARAVRRGSAAATSRCSVLWDLGSASSVSSVFCSEMCWRACS